MILKNNTFHFIRKSNLAPFVSIILGTTMSDHALITFSMESFDVLPLKFLAQFYLNTSFLDQLSIIAHIHHEWNLFPRPRAFVGWIDWWNDVIKRTIVLLITLGGGKCQEKDNLQCCAQK